MAKTEYEKNLNRHTASIVLWTAAAVLLVLLFLFLLLFRVRNIEVVGNYHYTDAQVEEMLMKGPFSKNTVILSLLNKHKKIEGADFIDSVTVDMTGINSVRIQVNEKELIGYVSYQNAYWYFDADGKVLVRSDTPENSGTSSGAQSGTSDSVSSVTSSGASGSESSVTSSGASDSSSSVTSSGASDPASSVTPSGASGSESSVTSSAASDPASSGTSSEDASGNSADSSAADSGVTPADNTAETVSEVIPQTAQAASEESTGSGTVTPQEVTQDSGGQVVLEPEVVQDDESTASSGSGVEAPKEADRDYIPLIEGLVFSEAAVGETLPVADPGVFKTIASLKNIVNKNNIPPDRVIFAEDGTLSLVYGQASVLLGADENLEAKLEELTGILPKMTDLSGTLHLENFDGTQDRVIFDKS
ncbi:MAG: FtsQ-type POTRA domain-containing protein [Lachnospiraceae bacterium]|jgi:hypothetical protein|nr:FtsQ-type POTRA domain-containing protein [Lachnospiraceae bacterium]